MIKIYKQSNNGEVGILTDCTNADDFLTQLADAIAKYIEFINQDESYCDQARDLRFLLPNAYDVLTRIKGDRNAHVNEKHLFFAGDSWPTSSEIPDVEV
jgi:hypothetical protein